MPTEAASVLHRPTTLGEPFRPALESPQSGAVVQEGSTLDELAEDFFHRRDGYPVALWGSTPISAFMRARTSVPVGSSAIVACGKDTPTLGLALCHYSARRVLYGGTQA
jgi:hypothetical protein